MKIEFISEDIDFQLDSKKEYIKWLERVCKEERVILGEIIYRFISEERILEINKKYLNHDYFTDIITFNHSFLHEISGDIYICLSIVRSNSKEFSGAIFEKELQRVIIHGLLHLIGYNDSNEKELNTMRRMEDYYMKMMIKR